jgi:ABC-type transporter Mla subunit MlaD
MTVPLERRALRDRWRSARDTRRAGRLMIGVGVAGALIVTVGTVVGWVFVGELTATSDETLDVTIQALDAVDDTIDLADDVLVSSADAVRALAATLTAVSGSFDAGTQAIDDIAALADTIGPSLEDAGSTVRTLARIGDDIDSVLRALSNVPLAPDYDPSADLGDTLGRLADTLEALPDQLADTSSSLTEFTGSAGELQAELDALAGSVGAISDDLADTGALVDRYRDSVADTRALAVATAEDLDTSATLMRVLLVIGGITLLIGQIVPLWLGRSLLDEADRLDANPVAAD